MTSWESIESVAEKLNDYSKKHSYTDWEAEYVAGLADDLIGLGVKVEDELKQVKRSAGGLSNKIRSMGDQIKKLEARLEELESENAKLRGKS